MSAGLRPPPGGLRPGPSCHTEPMELGSCLSWHQRQQKEKAASLKNKDALKTGLRGGADHRQDPHPRPHQLSLPPLLFCSEAVAFVRFPASRFRTLSRVCELSRICGQRRQPVNTLPPVGKLPQLGALSYAGPCSPLSIAQSPLLTPWEAGSHLRLPLLLSLEPATRRQDANSRTQAALSLPGADDLSRRLRASTRTRAPP